MQRLFTYITSSGLEIVGWNDDMHIFSNLLPLEFYNTLYGLYSAIMGPLSENIFVNIPVKNDLKLLDDGP